MICPKCDCHHDAPHQWCLDCLQWKASGEAAQRRESLEQMLGCWEGFNENCDLLETFPDEADLEFEAHHLLASELLMKVLDCAGLGSEMYRLNKLCATNDLVRETALIISQAVHNGSLR